MVFGSLEALSGASVEVISCRCGSFRDVCPCRGHALLEGGATLVRLTLLVPCSTLALWFDSLYPRITSSS